MLVLLIESTYGNRRHDRTASRERFARAVARTPSRGGTVVIPSFAVDRTEVVLHELAELRRSGHVPAGTRIWVDSPMALAALRVVPVRAELVNIPGFSAHADVAEIVDWLRDGGASPPSAPYLVHGEPDAAEALRDRIDDQLGWDAVVPCSGERVLVR
jgi:Cft2 family RNA processing exonuclease